MHSPITAIFLDIVVNLNKVIKGSVRCVFFMVNYIKTTFHYFF